MQAGSKSGQRYSLSFTGRGGEYFRIWIVNILLSIITLYIYSAWAKVRTRRYFAGNTVLDNSGFDYHATGLQILLGRIVAVALFLAITFGGAINPLVSLIASVALAVILPWAMWRSIKFNMRMSSFRNVRFGFDGKLWPMYWYVLILPFLPVVLAAAVAGLLYHQNQNVDALLSVLGIGVVMMFLLSPWVHKLFANYLLRNYRYGTAKFSGELSTGRFFKIYIKSFLLSIAILVGVIAVLGGIGFALMQLGIVSELDLQQLEDPEASDFSLQGGVALLFVVFSYAMMIVLGTLVMAYFRSRLREHLYERGLLDNRIDPESTVSTRGLWWVTFSNFFLVLLTVGLGYPWAKVRMARYLADNTAIYAETTLDDFVNAEQQKMNSLADELGEAFDMDVDVGF